MVARRKPEGWTEVNEFDWSGRKLCSQLNNIVAVQVEKSLNNLAVHERRCDYEIAILDAKIKQIYESCGQPNGSSNIKVEVPLKKS